MSVWPYGREPQTITKISGQMLYFQSPVEVWFGPFFEPVPPTLKDQLAEAQARVDEIRAEIVKKATPKIGSKWANNNSTESFVVVEIYHCPVSLKSWVIGRRVSQAGEHRGAGSYSMTDNSFAANWPYCITD